MIAVPAGFLDAASGSHAPRWRVMVLDAAGNTVVDGVTVTEGRITKDLEEAVVTVEIPTQPQPEPIDPNYLPTGGRLRVEFTIDNGAWVTIADMDMIESTLSRPDSLWRVTAMDQSGRIDVDDLARGGSVGTPATIGAAITALARRTLPDVVVQISGPAGTMPLPEGSIKPTGSPWATITRLAETAGSVAAFNHARVLVVEPEPDLGAPVDRLAVGEGGVLTGYQIKHEMGYNSVALVYEDDSGTVLRVGRWIDNRTDSPVAVYRIGSEVVFAQTSKVDTAPSQVDADAAAAALGRRVGGRARAPELRHPARPWLEPGDTVEVSYLGGPTEPQLINSVDIPISRDNIQVTRLRSHAYKIGAPA